MLVRGVGAAAGPAALGAVASSPLLPSKYRNSPLSFEPSALALGFLCPLHFHIRVDLQGAIFFDKIYSVIGEYAGDYGFPLPNPVFVC
jgi:hypothetical protein